MPKKRIKTVFSIDELSEEARKRAIAHFRESGRAFDDHDAKVLTEDFQALLEDKGIEYAKANWSLGYCQGDGVCFSGTINVRKVIEENKLKRFRLFIEARDIELLTARVHNNDSRYCHWNSMTVELELAGDAQSFMPGDLMEEYNDLMREQSHLLARWNREKYEIENEQSRVTKEWRNEVEKWERFKAQNPTDWSPRAEKPSSIPPHVAPRPIPPMPELPPLAPHLAEAYQASKAKFEGLEGLLKDFREWLENWVQEVSRELEKIGYTEIEYRQSDDAIVEHFVANEYEFDKDGDRV